MQSAKQKECNQQVLNPTLQPHSGDVEIPRAEWKQFFEIFGIQHKGWLASLSVTCKRVRSVKVHNARLQRITFLEHDEERQICIEVLAENNQPLTHQISNPVTLIFKRSMSGAHEGLDIASADGSVTSLRFRVAARPETLDGVLPDLYQTEHCAPEASEMRDQ